MRSLFSRNRRGKQKDELDKKGIEDIVQQELASYVKRDELQEYLAKIKADENKKKLWDSLSTHKKIKVLKYVLGKKGEEHGKK